MFSKVLAIAAVAAASVSAQQNAPFEWVMVFRRQRADQTHTINDLTTRNTRLFSGANGTTCRQNSDCAGAGLSEATVTA